MRVLRHARTRNAGIREERLRAAGGPEAPALSAWRGTSGRRYVVRVHPAATADLADVSNAVIMAVRRGADDLAQILEIVTAGDRPSASARSRWVRAMQERGATELHVHRLAGNEAQRRAIIDDLRAEAAAAP
jgi:hypothetical protein